MTEFFQPTTHGRAACTGNGCRSMVCTAGAVHCLNVCHPFCRQRDKMRHLVKCVLHDSRTGNNLSTDCVHASSVNMFKNKIDRLHLV